MVGGAALADGAEVYKATGLVGKLTRPVGVFEHVRGVGGRRRREREAMGESRREREAPAGGGSRGLRIRARGGGAGGRLGGEWDVQNGRGGGMGRTLTATVEPVPRRAGTCAYRRRPVGLSAGCREGACGLPGGCAARAGRGGLLGKESAFPGRKGFSGRERLRGGGVAL